MADVLLGPTDEPQNPGAVVAVHYGNSTLQELWTRSTRRDGQWCPLGGEFGMRGDVVSQRPYWDEVLERGPVTLLVPAGMMADDHD